MKKIAECIDCKTPIYEGEGHYCLADDKRRCEKCGDQINENRINVMGDL